MAVAVVRHNADLGELIEIASRSGFQVSATDLEQAFKMDWKLRWVAISDDAG